ncbi:MAG: OmpA family protein [Rhodospirillaceae bacterium]|nr:OmpA family protein [Rhodospirillaceae bacterium]
MNSNSTARRSNNSVANMDLSKSARNGLAVIALGLVLGGCSTISVPDSLNPTKWDFFADDAAVPEGSASTDDNQGLAADAEAPKPADRDMGAGAPSGGSGLSADTSSGNYASPPIQRQSEPTDYLSADATKIDEAPSPASAPAVAVTPAQPAPQPIIRQQPVSAPTPPAPDAVPSTRMAEAPPAEPVFNAPKAPVDTGPASIIQPRISSEAPPPEPDLQVRASANQMGERTTFNTVVISSDGIEDPFVPSSSAQTSMAPMTSVAPGAASAGSSVQFPVPGATTSGEAGSPNVGGMLRVATIYFDNNSDSLNSRDSSIVVASAQLLRERGGSLFVVGHASSRTSDMDYVEHAMTNFQISTARANRVASALKDAGVPESQLRVHAVSDTVPLYFEVMPSGEAGNRRVEIYLAP